MKLKDIKAVNFNKNGSGSISGRIILKKEWLEDMKINIDEPWIELNYDEKLKRIVIEKKNQQLNPISNQHS